MAAGQLIPAALSSVTYSQVALAVGVLSAVYALVLGVYRLYFHPLSHIPGPRLTALTYWVEIYYECFKPPGGQFMWEYQKWHERYGMYLSYSSLDGVALLSF